MHDLPSLSLRLGSAPRSQRSLIKSRARFSVAQWSAVVPLLVEAFTRFETALSLTAVAEAPAGALDRRGY